MQDINTLKYESLMASTIMYDPDDSSPTYIGLHSSPEATGAEVGWVIYKNVRNTSGNVTKTIKKRGIWDNRASMF